VHVRTDNQHIIRYEYVIDGQPVVDDPVSGYGIGILANHGECGSTSSVSDLSEYTAAAVLSGPHHYIWESTFRLAMCDHPSVAWRVTSQYVFIAGEDHFIQTVTYDSSDLPDDQPIGEDMRGPYNQTSWPGSGDISGFGWGSEYKFVTLAPIPDGDANVAGSIAVPWQWTEPNTIPYVWEWADQATGAAVDREYGIVQNQPYREQDFGGGYFGCGSDCFAQVPPLMGDALPAAWAMPSQMSSYDSNYRSGRITWGQTYGTFENGHANDTGSISDMGDHFRPINAWSWTHVVGKFSEGQVAARVTDTENSYASRLTASTGRVLSSGPRGPGDFVGPAVGSMPTYEWSNPGFDFIYRSWNIEAEAGVAEGVLQVVGSLVRPLFVIHDFPSEQAVLFVDGEQLVDGSDFLSSYDAESGRLWVSLGRSLDAGEHSIEIRESSETTTSTTSPNTTTSSGGATSSADATATSAGGDASGTSSTTQLGSTGGAASGQASDGVTGVTAPTGPTNEGSDSAEGCACRAVARSESRASGWLGLLLLAIAAARRRQPSLDWGR
jgi:MYXO-CTERM domain-containing protein